MMKATKQVPAARRSVGRPRKTAASAGESLGRDQILRVALDLIDENGLAAFNIRTLATRLGVFPSAIYWHVPSRDELVSGAVALALDGVGAGLPEGSWQVRLAALLRNFRTALRAHPHLAPAVASELAYNAVFDAELLNCLVEILEDARFEGNDLVDSFNAAVAAMCGFATLELSTPPDGPSQEWEQACRERIDAIDPAQHPHLARYRKKLQNRAFLLRWSGGTEKPLDSGFEAWIDVFIRGLESRSRALRR